MALSEEDKKELLDAIRVESNDVAELEVVSTIDNVNSLPAMRGEELVSVPISLLSKQAEDAAKKAEESAKKAEESISGLEEKTQAASEAADLANAAAAKAASAASFVENSTGFAVKGATARFFGIVDDAAIESQSSTQTGGQIIYVRASGIFAYCVGGKYYNSWNVAGTPPPDMYLNADKTGILRDKLYLFGNSVYTATSGTLTLLAHPHEIMSEEQYAALGEISDTTIYLTYEDEEE